MGKYPLTFLMLLCAEKEKLRVRKEFFLQHFMRSQEVGVPKMPKFSIVCNINRVETTKISILTKPNRFYSTVLSPFALRHCQLRPHRRGRMGKKPEKFTASLACKGKSRQTPGVSEGNLKSDPEEGTVIVAHKVELT